MSENLDLVRSICAAWERGDFSSAEWADPMIRYVWADGPAPSGSTGVAQMTAGWRAFLDNWMDIRIDVDEYRVLDDGRVLVLMQRTGRGKSSGIELGQMQTHGAALFDSVTARFLRWSSTSTASAPSPTSAWRDRR